MVIADDQTELDELLDAQKSVAPLQRRPASGSVKHIRVSKARNKKSGQFVIHSRRQEEIATDIDEIADLEDREANLDADGAVDPKREAQDIACYMKLTTTDEPKLDLEVVGSAEVSSAPILRSLYGRREGGRLRFLEKSERLWFDPVTSASCVWLHRTPVVTKRDDGVNVCGFWCTKEKWEKHAADFMKLDTAQLLERQDTAFLSQIGDDASDSQAKQRILRSGDLQWPIDSDLLDTDDNSSSDGDLELTEVCPEPTDFDDEESFMLELKDYQESFGLVN